MSNDKAYSSMFQCEYSAHKHAVHMQHNAMQSNTRIVPLKKAALSTGFSAWATEKLSLLRNVSSNFLKSVQKNFLCATI